MMVAVTMMVPIPMAAAVPITVAMPVTCGAMVGARAVRRGVRATCRPGVFAAREAAVPSSCEPGMKSTRAMESASAVECAASVTATGTSRLSAGRHNTAADDRHRCDDESLIVFAHIKILSIY